MMVNAGFNRNINYDIILDLLKMIWLFFLNGTSIIGESISIFFGGVGSLSKSKLCPNSDLLAEGNISKKHP